jgi:5-methylthioadenosine/S-adenosylhomocysteine deaminase
VSLAVTGTLVDGGPVGVRVEDGRIAELGTAVAPGPGDEVIDGSGTALVRGLVNGHTHAAMTLFRGYGDDMPLMEWLRDRIWPIEARLEHEDVYWGARLACLEMVRSGTVAFWDMYWHAGATARAVADAGIRAVIGAPLIDGGEGEGIGGMRDVALRSLDEVGEVDAGDRISRALAPHAIYTVGEESLRWVAATAAERGLVVQIHLSETEQEVTDCVEAHGVRPATYLDAVGLLGPRTVLAHGVWLDRAELELIAERGATVVTNPVANLKLAVGGTFPYLDAREAGVRIGLGTDGAGSNNSLDLLSDAKHFALGQKQRAGDPAAVTAAETWEIATGARSPLLGGEAAAPAVGDAADFILVRADAPELTPGDLVANLVYAASGSVVDTTVVAGRVLMRGGLVEGAEEVRDRALERARRLGIA